MLEERELITDTRSIMLFFKIPTVPPTKYIFHYICRHLGHEEYYKDRDKSTSETMNCFRATHVYPGSQCEINVMTVYHPASLDPGLCYIVNTYLSR